MSTETLRRCPRCGNRRFHLRLEGGRVLLSVDASGAPVDADAGCPALLGELPLGCTGCSWEGTADELSAPL